MINQAYIRNFSPRLSSIPEKELAIGNKITETFKGWPQEGTIIVFLQQPFSDEYANDDVEYSNVNDRHYWKAECRDKLSGHILACKF